MRISDWSSDVCSSDLGGGSKIDGSGAGGATREPPSRVSAPEQAELVEQPGPVDYASGTKGRVPLVFPPGGSCHHRQGAAQGRTFSGSRMARARTAPLDPERKSTRLKLSHLIAIPIAASALTKKI